MADHDVIFTRKNTLATLPVMGYNEEQVYTMIGETNSTHEHYALAGE